MEVIVKEVSSKADLREFIHLPAKLHKGHRTWIPPVYSDDWTYFNPQKNLLFSHCDTTLALALKDGEVVGRIMGIIHRDYNKLHNENHGRFSFFECPDDPEIAHALIVYVENWARNKGMTTMIGPFGFSDKDPEGFMIDGFDQMAIIVTNHNFPYMVDLLSAEGYSKKIDCVDYMLDISGKMPELYTKIFDRISRKREYNLIEFTSRSQLKPYIRPIFHLLNETYQDLYGFIPMTELEMDDFAKRYLSILNPNYIKAVEKDGQILSFVIGIPNFSKGLQRSKGYLFPFGVFHILSSIRKAKQIDLMLGAIRDSHRGIGLDVIMGYKMIESAKAGGIERIECHLVLETNARMRAEMERMGAKVHKKFRIFQKPLA
jgi:hypothetical protein